MPRAYKACRFCGTDTLHAMGICAMDRGLASAEAYARVRLRGGLIEDARTLADVVEVALTLPREVKK